MSNFLNTRDPDAKFSADEFAGIPRDARGDIVDLHDAYCFITNDQREQLSEDDWSRMQDIDEEIDHAWSEYFA